MIVLLASICLEFHILLIMEFIFNYFGIALKVLWATLVVSPGYFGGSFRYLLVLLVFSGYLVGNMYGSLCLVGILVGRFCPFVGLFSILSLVGRTLMFSGNNTVCTF